MSGSKIGVNIIKALPKSEPKAAPSGETRATPQDPPSSVSRAFDAVQALGEGKARAALIDDNVTSFAARWNILKQSRDIDATYYIYERDIFGMAMTGAMLKKQNDGGHVRLMTDELGCFNLGKNFVGPFDGDYLQEIVNVGGEVCSYNPVLKRVPNAIEQRNALALVSSNHGKILNGRSAPDAQGRVTRLSMTGGRNISAEYLTSRADYPKAWSDHDVYMEGQAPAEGLEVAFDREWKGCERIEPDKLGNWVDHQVELYASYTMMDLWLNDPPMSEAAKQALRNDPLQQEALARGLCVRTLKRLPADGLKRIPTRSEKDDVLELCRELVKYADQRGSIRKLEELESKMLDVDVKILDQTSHAYGRINEIRPALQKVADAIAKTFYFKNPYVAPVQEEVKALQSMSNRGVQIVGGTNSPTSTDSTTTQTIFLNDWAELMKRMPNLRIFVVTSDYKQHSKVYLADEEVSFVSTYNFDLISGQFNSEEGALIRSKAFAQTVKDSFVSQLNDPEFKVVEYKIKRDSQGKVMLDTAGAPLIEYGPNDHTPPKLLEAYAKKQKMWDWLVEHVPVLKSLALPDAD